MSRILMHKYMHTWLTQTVLQTKGTDCICINSDPFVHVYIMQAVMAQPGRTVGTLAQMLGIHSHRCPSTLVELTQTLSLSMERTSQSLIWK